ncbi:MAG: PAS/PAC sensor-containing diguanylate cyclase/phosphodiesterase, partial [Marinobacter sp. T13-3]
VQTDITDRKEAQERLQHIAHFDPLTDLPNRELVFDRLRTAMSQAKRRRTMVGVAFIDLDGFKQVNDTLGHDAGDELLKAIARRLSRVLREGDTLGRIGGDEFVAILIDLENRNDLECALSRLVQAASEPVEIHGKPVSVSASVGATVYSDEYSIDADQLVRRADQAMYDAKLAGKNRYHIDMPEITIG